MFSTKLSRYFPHVIEKEKRRCTQILRYFMSVIKRLADVVHHNTRYGITRTQEERKRDIELLRSFGYKINGEMSKRRV